jgi:hypothetical protein
MDSDTRTLLVAAATHLLVVEQSLRLLEVAGGGLR